MNWDEVVDALVEEVSARVIKKLQEANGSDWPSTRQIKPPEPENTIKPKDFVRTFDRVKDNAPESTTPDPGDEPVKPKTEEIKLGNGRVDTRKEYWKGKPVADLRNLVAKFEGKSLDYYKDKNKAELIEYAAKLEALTGHDLDEADDDPEDAVVEPEPDAEDELIYDDALKLPLAELKQIALEEGIEADALNGLDVEAVVDLIFGAEEDNGLTVQDLMAMSLDELKVIADQNDVKYNDTTIRQDLALAIADQVGHRVVAVVN